MSLMLSEIAKIARADSRRPLTIQGHTGILIVEDDQIILRTEQGDFSVPELFKSNNSATDEFPDNLTLTGSYVGKTGTTSKSELSFSAEYIFGDADSTTELMASWERNRTEGDTIEDKLVLGYDNEERISATFSWYAKIRTERDPVEYLVF